MAKRPVPGSDTTATDDEGAVAAAGVDASASSLPKKARGVVVGAHFALAMRRLAGAMIRVTSPLTQAPADEYYSVARFAVQDEQGRMLHVIQGNRDSLGDEIDAAVAPLIIDYSMAKVGAGDFRAANLKVNDINAALSARATDRAKSQAIIVTVVAHWVDALLAWREQPPTTEQRLFVVCKEGFERSLLAVALMYAAAVAWEATRYAVPYEGAPAMAATYAVTDRVINSRGNEKRIEFVLAAQALVRRMIDTALPEAELLATGVPLQQRQPPRCMMCHRPLDHYLNGRVMLHYRHAGVAMLPLLRGRTCMAAACSLDAYVPRDSRTEWPVVPAGTTLFQSRVAPSRAADVGPGRFASAYFALTPAHPCTIMRLSLLETPPRTGEPVLYEYETVVPVNVSLRQPEVPRDKGVNLKYDEVILNDVRDDPTKVRLVRTYTFDAATVRRSRLLGAMRASNQSLPADGGPGRRTSLGSEKLTPSAYPGTQLAWQALGETNYDLEYRLLRQFWQKGDTRALTLLAVAIGIVPRGNDFERACVIFYDNTTDGAPFSFQPPLRYRSDVNEAEEADPRPMRPAVGILVILANRRQGQHQVEVLGCAYDQAHEADVLAIADQILAGPFVFDRPWLSPSVTLPRELQTAYRDGRLPHFAHEAERADATITF